MQDSYCKLPNLLRHQAWRSLHKTQLAMQDEIAALKQCLLSMGILTFSQVDIVMHRQRLAKVREASGWHPDDGLKRTLNANELYTQLSEYAGKSSMQAFSLVSTSVHAATHKTVLCICGGLGEGGTTLKSAECFDPQTGSWESLPPMLIRRHGHVAGTIAGDIYVCGGFGPFGLQFGATVERFYMHSFKWETRKSMNTPRANHAAVVIAGQLCVTGGLDSLLQGLRSAESFDPSNGDQGVWHVLPHMLHPRCLHCAVVMHGKVHVAGGASRLWSGNGIPEVEFLDAKKNEWETALSTPALCCQTMTAMSGCIYICGGQLDFTVFDSVVRYNTTTGSSEQVSGMLTPRRAHAAAAIAGQLYVVGGATQAGDLASSSFPDLCRRSSMEVFDVDGGTWKSAAAIPETRSHHAIACCSRRPIS